MSSPAKHLYEFGPFRLDTAERILLRDGHPVSLTPKAYEVLLALVRRAGHIVEKDELMRDIWADAFVEEGNLTHHIFTLRKALGEGSNAREYIETIPRRGYRFVSRVQEVPAERIDQSDYQSGLASAVQEKGYRAGRTGSLIGWAMGHKKAIALVTIVVFSLIALTLYKYLDRVRSGSHSTATSRAMHVRELTTDRKATTAWISPDGKYVVHSQEDGGRQSLWLKQVATLSEVQIVPPSEVRYFGGTFTPDGNYLVYTMEEKNGSTDVYQVSAMGGTPKKILKGIRGPVTLSPDGKQFAFVRGNLGQADTSLWIANADGAEERKLATRKDPERFDYEVGIGPAWSPDGKVIACSVGGVDAAGDYHTVVGVGVEGGEQKSITQQRWSEGGQMAWRPDGSGLVLVGDSQVWQLSYPEGVARKITNDANSYVGISLAANSNALVTVKHDIESSIWVVSGGNVEGAQPIISGRREGYNGLSWTPDGKIVYTSLAGGNVDIWLVAIDGTGRKQLTANTGSWNYAPSVSPDGRYIVFTSTRTGIAHIWRMNIDGSDPRQLTNGPEERWPECSLDGKWVVYVSFAVSTAQNLWKVPIEGGNPMPVTSLVSNMPALSPDGKHLAFRSGNGTDQPLKISVMSLEDGRLMKTFDIQPTTILVGDFKVLRWTPDGGGLAYIDTRTGTANIWVRPLDGGPERQLTNFKSEQMFKFAWSRDGKQLAVTRGAMLKDVILISGFE
jgi:eukaryotic-like serine/threonine-protein kinase